MADLLRLDASRVLKLGCETDLLCDDGRAMALVNDKTMYSNLGMLIGQIFG